MILARFPQSSLSGSQRIRFRMMQDNEPASSRLENDYLYQSGCTYFEPGASVQRHVINLVHDLVTGTTNPLLTHIPILVGIEAFAREVLSRLNGQECSDQA